MSKRKGYRLTQADQRVLRQARRWVREIMRFEGLSKADMIRRGIPDQSLRWFLDHDGNITIGALNRIVTALGYQMGFGFKPLKREERDYAGTETGVSNAADSR